ncbi:YsnF/AvaK domain-containing protein [Falsiroseomonas oryzae]|uniref:YsnF/AvaK domain-containing protein n=1 Tax=Falsiroseomonas oryzae TaxID=2766473 RepID=UPI0022EB2C99|nr:YsnF/AvaK domain-containing protein [Roseomonas sp. MO-31]
MSDTTIQREARAAERATAGMGRAMQRSTEIMGRATERSAIHMERAAGRAAGTALDTAMTAGMAWWDLMLQMQRASLASLSVYSPGSDTRVTATGFATGAEGSAVVPVGEERLNIGTRTVLGETTRIRRRVVAQPVEQEVTLRDERVVVERRPGSAQAAAGQAEVLTETVVEMTDSRQVPQVWKTVHVAEEVVLRREVSERKARVRETLRRDVVEVEHEGSARGAIEAAATELPAPGQAQEVEEAARQQAEALARAAAETTRQRAETASDQANEERRRREAAAKEAASSQPAPGGRKG